jgi:signal transduction histidine kinase
MLLRKFINILGLNSIQGRMTSIAFFFILATAMAIGVAGFRLTVNFESRRFHEHFGLLATYMASNAEVGVLLGSESALKLLSENMLQVGEVQIVRVIDQAGQVIIERSNQQVPAEIATVSAPVFASFVDTSDPLMFNEGQETEVLGTVYLSYSLAGLSQLRELLAQRFVLLSLMLALAPIVMYWLLSRAINAPLLRLLSVARQVSNGQVDVRAKSSSLREIDTLSRSFNEMLDALASQRRKLNAANEAMARQQVLAEVGKFSMTVAHEIKNPLAIIKGGVDILRKDGPVDPVIKERMMRFVDEEIVRINKLIEDFLLFARPRPPAFQARPVSELVDSLVQRVKLIDPSIEVELEVNEEQRRFEVQCDLGLLERALFNVVRNASEASVGRGPVCLGIASSQGCLVFNVVDDGPGIKPDEISRIFEPFFTRKAKGTGLGLAIARNVMNAHGGQITVANRAQGGASFTLSVPMLINGEGDLAQNAGHLPGAFCDLEETL